MKPFSLYQNPLRKRTIARRQTLRPQWRLFAALLCALLLDGQTSLPTLAADHTGDASPGAAVDWLEPRGVNVIDLVGLAPEEHLKDTIVRYQPGVGLAYYESGERSGDTLRVRLRYSASPTDAVLCPGKPASFDEWPSVVPASTMRVYSGAQEITDQVLGSYTYFPAGLNQPVANTAANYRYPPAQGTTIFDNDGAVQVPANMGCQFQLNGDFADVTAEFVFNTPNYLSLSVLGSTTGVFHSYIGPGNAGALDSLRNQMRSRYGDRADDISVDLPDGAEFILVKYPATPVDPYGDPTLAGAGTYRIRRSNGKLSVDHVNTMALPFYGQWQDADQSAGSVYLPAFRDGVRVAAPEYFVPAGISYDPCMTNGGCPSSLLQDIYNAEMTLEIHFYRIDRIRSGLTQVPLRQVGPAWSAAATAEARATSPVNVHAESPVAIPPFQVVTNLYLPLVTSVDIITPDDPTNCPCGWFDADGRMFDFVAGP